MTGNEIPQLSRDRLKTIARAIADGRRDEAKALYRESTGKDMIDAVEFVDLLTAQLKAKYPERFTDISPAIRLTAVSAIPKEEAHLHLTPLTQSRSQRVLQLGKLALSYLSMALYRTLLLLARWLGRELVKSWNRYTLMGRVKAIILIIFLVFLVIRITFPPDPISEHISYAPLPYTSTVRTPERSGSDPTIGNGSEATLFISKGEDVPVASSEADDSRLTELAVAHDSVGINQMLLSGRAWGVASGTKCLVINRGFFKSEVRISDGPNAGRSGWVKSDFLKPVSIAIDLPSVKTNQNAGISILHSDHFDMTAMFVPSAVESATKRRLVISIKTDLPDATPIMVGVQRSYWNSTDHEEYVAEYYATKSAVGEWRHDRLIELDQAKWQKGVDDQADRLRRMGEKLLVSKIDDAVVVDMVVPINVSGDAVKNSGTSETLRREVRLSWLIKRD